MRPYSKAFEKVIRDLRDKCRFHNLHFDSVFEYARKLFAETPDFSMLDAISAVRGMIDAGDIQENWKPK